MPRLDLTPLDEETNKALWQWGQEQGTSTSTVDVCLPCARLYVGKPLKEILDLEAEFPYNGEPEGNYTVDGDVAHPPYSDCDYDCPVCGELLTDADEWPEMKAFMVTDTEWGISGFYGAHTAGGARYQMYSGKRESRGEAAFGDFRVNRHPEYDHVATRLDRSGCIDAMLVELDILSLAQLGRIKGGDFVLGVHSSLLRKS